MARPREHGSATREALLDAAERLLSEGGPAAVSVRATADAVDVSTRAVYSLFGSKQALVEGLAARGFGYLADLVEGLPTTADPAADLVQAGVGAFRTFAVGRPHLFRLTFDRISADVFTRPDVYPELRRALSALRARVDRAASAGRLGTHDPFEVAYMFHAISHGLAANELSRLPPPVGAGFWRMAADVDMEAVWRTTLRAFVAGLATVPSTPGPSPS